MNSSKSLLKLMVVAQVFTLCFLVFTPLIIKLLNEAIGKFIFSLFVVVSVGLAIALRYAMVHLE